METILLLHLTRVDDVMCFKQFLFVFLVHQWLTVNVIAIFLSRVLTYKKNEISLPVGCKTARPKPGDWE